MTHNPMPDASEMEQLGREIEHDCAKGRPASLGKASREWSWNESVYADQRGHPESSTRTEQWGLELAGRTARNSWQAEMSPQGEPLSPFGAPLELLTRSQIEQLRVKARTAKGRRRLQLLAASLLDAELALR